ncbi:branched-chain amino acid aminotransferase [Rubrimonas cliftonensis]|uniref:Branched-chain-amino-acid aminotransferase n=1 Tax=Rubrimonas cliftonensis TaxID=89524 RepID=A0A1H3YQ13_9RHOB|nr:branched-chain amino acid aminotransferase [Rubrimonas cliftonensis]SEA13168.1 branched chain amino acid aminotransferase apoenzyme [Rubrimonas cliftonensis]
MSGPAYDDRDGWIWMDGEYIPWREAKVHILTHAMHYGSSVFEGERAYGGKIFESRRHSERLAESARLLGFKLPYDIDAIEAVKLEVMKRNDLSDAYIRPLAWRGSEMMGVSAQGSTIHLAIAAWSWGAYYGDAKMKGARLDIAEWKRPSPETIPCRAKASGLYMICTLSKHAAEAKGYSDALMMDWRGYVAEATGANIFFVKEGKVHTPLPDCFLNGITRQSVIAMMRERQIEVVERHIEPAELEGFEQCWLTGTAAEVTPVAEIGPYRFEVGQMAKDMVSAYDAMVRAA